MIIERDKRPNKTYTLDELDIGDIVIRTGTTKLYLVTYKSSKTVLDGISLVVLGDINVLNNTDTGLHWEVDDECTFRKVKAKLVVEE